MNEDKMIAMLLGHGEKIERIEYKIDHELATKEDVRELHDTLDKIVGLMEKRDQETTMQTSGMKRHEERIENLEDDVGRIMPLVGLA